MVSHVDITLLRHGRTVDNELGRYSGWIDSKLSKLGIKEIQKMKRQYDHQALFSKGVDHIYTSDLTRTIDTSRLLFEGKYPITHYKDLREMSFGDFEGRTYEELKENHQYQKWLNNLFTYQLPKGESFVQFTERIDACFNDIRSEIIENDFKHVVIVVHGGVIRHLLTQLTNSTRDYFEWQTPFAQGYQLRYLHSELKEEKRCISLRVVPSMENGIL